MSSKRPGVLERGDRAVLGEAPLVPAGELAAVACDPPDPADYRRALVTELVRRALLTARERAA